MKIADVFVPFRQDSIVIPFMKFRRLDDFVPLKRDDGGWNLCRRALFDHFVQAGALEPGQALQ